MRQSLLFCTSLTLLLSVPAFLVAQTQTAANTDSLKANPPRRSAQSPYYDALALYYTVNNFKAYPVYVGNSTSLGYDTATPHDSTGKGKTSQNPLFQHGPSAQIAIANEGGNLATTSYYSITEIATGKILMDTTSDLSVLNTPAYTYTTPDDMLLKQSILDTILARHAGIFINSTTTRADIRNAYNNNVYIQPLLNAQLNIAPPINTLLVPTNSVPSKIGGGLPSATTLAEGLTDFLVGRVNEEFNDAFIVHVYHALHDVPEFAILFPNTLESLNKIQIANYSASLSAIKSAYSTDIKAILSNVSKLATIPRYQQLINKYPELTTLFLACDMIDMINKQTVPAEILYQLGNAPYITQTQPNNYSSIVKLAALLSNTFRDNSLGQQNPARMGWLDISRIGFLKANNNQNIFIAFMGFLAQQAGGIQFFDNQNHVIFDFQAALNNPATSNAVSTGRFLLYNFSQTLTNIATIAGTLQNGSGKSANTSDFVAGYISMGVELLNMANECLGALPTTRAVLDIDQVITKIKNNYVPLLQRADTVLSQLEGANYSMAVYTTDRLIQQLTSQYAAKLTADSTADVAANNAAGLKQVEQQQANLQKFETSFLQYGMFIASVASAKTSADISSAISAFALPKGSSRIKKEHTFSVGLNAYVGPYYAINHSYPGLALPRTEWGLTAPVGIAFNWGISQFLFLHQFSLSAFAGIIDVGAIFTYKVQTDSSLTSSIQLGQLLSPSASIVLGLPIIRKYNIPISIGCNLQWGPKLRSVTETGNSVLPLLTKRTTIFAAFDLPIINFYTSKKLTKAP